MSEIFLSEDEVSKLDPWSVPIDEIDVSTIPGYVE